MKNFIKDDAYFCVENVKPYYDPLIAPDAVIHRHYYWSNFNINQFEVTNDRSHRKVLGLDEVYGFDITQTKIKDKRKALRNMVDPELGLHILNCAMNIQQPVNFGLFA